VLKKKSKVKSVGIERGKGKRGQKAAMYFIVGGFW
jgi:hypothetical protein